MGHASLRGDRRVDTATGLGASRDRALGVRVVRGVVSRLAWPTRRIVLRAPRTEDGAVPDGLALVRLASGIGAAGAPEVVEAAMRAAGEPEGLVAPRLAHGDEFFGWAAGGRVVSFGWVTYRDRMVGPAPLAEAPGRAFLFHFHTRAEFRGRGLYPALLLAIRRILAEHAMTEFIIDVDVRNMASRRGIARAGFVAVGAVSYLTVLTRRDCLVRSSVLDRTIAPLFRFEPGNA